MNYYTNKLQKLDERLKYLSRKYSNESYIFNCDNNNILDKDVLEKYKYMLRQGSGIIIITNVVIDKEISEIKEKLKECVKQMYNTKTCECKNCKYSKDIIPIVRSVQNGFATPGFAFLYHHYSLTNDIPKIHLNKYHNSKTYLSYLPIHHEVIMRLMCQEDKDSPLESKCPLRTHYLKYLSQDLQKEEPIMISWSSCKLVEGPDSDFESNRTIEHIDVYDNIFETTIKIDRVQAMINDDEKTKLFYVPYSWDKEVVKLLAELEGKADLFCIVNTNNNGGARGVLTNPDILKVIDKYAIAPPPKSMVLWRYGIIHFEAKSYLPSNSLLYKVKYREDRSSDKRLRFPVGTHKPLDQNGHLLTQEVLEKLAFLASRHLVPNYNNKINKDSIVYPNIMNPKMSNDPYYRIIPYKEKKIVEEALKELENGEWKQEYEKLPKLYKEMYGCLI